MFTVLMDTISPDSIPSGGVNSAYDFDPFVFIFGILIGTITTLAIIGIIKYTKFIIKDNKKMQEKINSQNSDE